MDIKKYQNPGVLQKAKWMIKVLYLIIMGLLIQMIIHLNFLRDLCWKFPTNQSQEICELFYANLNAKVDESPQPSASPFNDIRIVNPTTVWVIAS